MHPVKFINSLNVCEKQELKNTDNDDNNITNDKKILKNKNELTEKIFRSILFLIKMVYVGIYIINTLSMPFLYLF